MGDLTVVYIEGGVPSPEIVMSFEAIPTASPN